MATLLQDTVIREFMKQDAENKRRAEVGEPQIAIMPKDMSEKLRVNEATIRSILKRHRLWEPRHRDAAKVETLARINAAKKRAGNPSLERQRERNFDNLVKARAVLAQMQADRKKQVLEQAGNVHA